MRERYKVFAPVEVSVWSVCVRESKCEGERQRYIERERVRERERDSKTSRQLKQVFGLCV